MAALAGAGGGGGFDLDFSQSATKGVPGVVMELKVCEWGCGATFVRPLPRDARRGQKVCRQCLAKQPEERKLAQYAER